MVHVCFLTVFFFTAFTVEQWNSKTSGRMWLMPPTCLIQTKPWIRSHSQTLQSPAVVCCLPACCKFPFHMLEQTLWTSFLPFFPFSPPLFLSISPLRLGNPPLSLQLVYCGVNPFFVPDASAGFFFAALHRIALPDCCNHVLEKASQYLFSATARRIMASCPAFCATNKEKTHK